MQEVGTPGTGLRARQSRARLAGAASATVAAGLALAVVAASLGAGLGVALAHRQQTASAGNSTFSLPATPAPTTPQASTPSSAAIAAKVDPGVVDVTTSLGYQNGSAAGTGMVLTSSGEILTNNHVVNGATKVNVQVDGQGRIYSAKVVGTDVTDDVAVLQVQGASGWKTLNLGDSSKVAAGDAVVAIGNALNLQGPPSVTQGTITALNQSITANDEDGTSENLTGLIESDAPLRPGDSGGPLVNTSGQVIGMDTAASTGGRRFQAGSGSAFAIPINKAKSIADQIFAGHASATVRIGLPPFLGVEVQPSSVGAAARAGAPVAGIVPGTPAASAGIAAGDTIVSIDGKSISTPSDLTQLLKTHKPGDTVQVGWVTPSGQHRSASVKLATGPAD